MPSSQDFVTIDPGGVAEPARVRWSHAAESSPFGAVNRSDATPAFEPIPLVDFAPIAARPVSLFATGYAGGTPRLGDVSTNESPTKPSASRSAVASDGSRTNLVFRSTGGDANSHNNKTPDVRFDLSGGSQTNRFSLRRTSDGEFRNGSVWIPAPEIVIGDGGEGEQGAMEGASGNRVAVSWSSEGEGVEYEAPESHQCTVSSLTPLLRASGGEEGEDGRSKDGR